MMNEPTATVNQLAAALRYAALGWQVIPLHTPTPTGCSCARPECGRSAGKHPRMNDWVKRATTDETAIKGWWRAFPQANVGLVTGARSGFVVLDIDPDKGGEQSLALLCAEHGALPSTVEALTGSGGRHLLFKYPGHHVPNSTSRLGPGLDIRGDGGQIVAAPSIHRSGGTYEWQHDCEPGKKAIAEAPSWLLELIREPVREPAAPPPRPQPIDQASRRASAYLARLPGAVSGERGHDTTWKAALAIVRGFRLSEGEALQLLLSEYNPRCSPPWSEKEIQHKVSQAANNSSVPFGYLLDAERTSAPKSGAAATLRREQDPRTSGPTSGPAATREPGSDDGDPPAAPTPAPKKSRLNLQPISVLLAEVIPPTIWLMAPWIESNTIGAIVAPPGIGKTLLAFHFATQVAAAGSRVAIIEEEGGKRGFQARVRRAVAAAGGPEKCVGVYFTFKPRISLMSPSDVSDLCDELKGYDLVIIDSLARVTTGMEENDAKEMGQIVHSLDIIRESTGAAVFSIHHTGKAKWKPGEVPTLADGRGSSSFVAGLDTVIGLAPIADEEQLAGVVAFTIHITKQRDEDNKVPPRLVRITMTGPEAYVEMEEVKPSSSGPSPAQQRMAALLPSVLNAIPLPPADPITREALQDLLGKRRFDVIAAVNKLVDERKVKELSRRRLIRVPSNGAADGYYPSTDRTGERSE